MEKFDRIYDMRVSTPSGENIAIRLPFRLELDIHRSALGIANCAQFKIWNLPAEIRSKLRLDISTINARQEIALKAGYKSIHKNLNDLPLIFRGSIKSSFSARSGTDWITTIESYDGGFAISNSSIEREFTKGESYRSSIEKVLDLMEGVKLGKVSKKILPDDKKFEVQTSFDGKISHLLNQMFGNNNWFIDNGLVNIVDYETEALTEGIYKTIDESVGLLETPIRSDCIIDFKLTFEPRLLIGQLINLRSSTDPAFNGTYKLVTIKHRGTIAETICGELITSCRVFKGTSKLQVVDEY